jgi:hypothetical protein
MVSEKYQKLQDSTRKAIHFILIIFSKLDHSMGLDNIPTSLCISLPIFSLLSWAHNYIATSANQSEQANQTLPIRVAAQASLLLRVKAAGNGTSCVLLQQGALGSAKLYAWQQPRAPSYWLPTTAARSHPSTHSRPHRCIPMSCFHRLAAAAACKAPWTHGSSNQQLSEVWHYIAVTFR